MGMVFPLAITSVLEALATRVIPPSGEKADWVVGLVPLMTAEARGISNFIVPDKIDIGEIADYLITQQG